MKIIERQFLSILDVRAICIKENLYTEGTNEQYDSMFGKVRALKTNEIITADYLYPIALDILDHSNTNMNVTSIMYLLAEKIVRCYEIV